MSAFLMPCVRGGSEGEKGLRVSESVDTKECKCRSACGSVRESACATVCVRMHVCMRGCEVTSAPLYAP